MIKFQKVTSSRYIGTDGYNLQKLRDGSFSIIKDNSVTKWGNNFETVRSAEIFLNSHDYIHASADNIPISREDAKLIYNIYCVSGNKRFGSKWYIKSNFWIQGGFGHLADSDFNFIQFNCSDGSCYTNADKLVEKLETVTASIFTKKSEQIEILARKMAGNKNTGGLSPKDLMRVKSSNVWAIGVEVNDKNRREGDVYVQFKGKDGGPQDVYKYYDVPLTLYRRFITAPSHGAFVWKYLRNNFLYSKLTGDKRGKLRNAVN